MEDKAKCGASLYWHNCYKGAFDVISSSSMAHPAKMAPALCFRILQHLEELGLVKKGDTILDPMAGTGITNICAGAMGYPSISVELEEKFIGFEQQNKDYAEKRLYKSLDWMMIKGDSRRLSELLTTQGLKSIMSPPYSDSMTRGGNLIWQTSHNRPHQESQGKNEIYGDNPDNIGNLKDTPLKSITSPPYMDAANPDHTADLEVRRLEIAKEKGISPDKVSHLDYTKTVKSEGYGETEGQIGKLKDKPLKSIVSPPYEDTTTKTGGNQGKGKYSGTDLSQGINRLKDDYSDYGDAEGQIGKLKDKPLKSIVSPPYSEAQSGGGIAKKGYTGSKHSPTDLVGNRSYMPEVHGQSEGQIANLKDIPLKAITSPPYMDSDMGKVSEEIKRDSPRKMWNDGERYGQAEGQIGNLKDKPLKSIVSPPYGETGVGDWKTGRAEFQAWVINEIKTKGYVEWQGKRYTETEWRAMNHGRIDGRTTKGVHKHPTDGYSDNPDNIGGLPDKPLKAITSPPYTEARPQSSWEPQEAWQPEYKGRGKSYHQNTKGQISALPDKPLKSITSPPYGDAEKRDRSKEASNEKEKDYPRGDHNISAGYQGSDDNIGKLADKPLKSVVSPPYGLGKGTGHSDNKRDTRPILKDRNVHLAYNDESADNIGNLADKPLKSVMSPPYDKNVVDRYDRIDDNRLHKEKGIAMNYGRSEGQVAQEGQESYLSAMKKVYSEIALVSDVLCVVVKNPTRNGKIRRLDSDTISILEASGWSIHCQHRALLFEELEQADMFEGSKKQVKGRLSFFKRLSWQNGNPVASWEDILICVRK